MDSLKNKALQSISNLPDSANLDDIMYQLFVVEKIHKGQQEAEAGDTLTLAQVKEEIKKW